MPRNASSDGHDRALRAGLAAEALALAAVLLDSFVDDAVREQRMVLRAVDVGPHAAVVDVGVAALRHARQHRHHRFEGIGDRPQLDDGAIEVSGRDRGLRTRDGIERRRRARFDLDVHEDEPLLVDAAEEVLEQREIAERDRTRGVEPAPVVERVRGVGEHRRPAEPSRRGVPGQGDAARQARRDLRTLPHPAVPEIGEEEHRAPQLGTVVEHRRVEDRHAREHFARGLLRQQLGQLGRDLLPRSELRGEPGRGVGRR